MSVLKLVSKNPLVRKIAEGEAKKEMLNLLLAGQLPFTEEEYLESLVFLIKYPELKSKALEVLKTISESTKLNYIEKHDSNNRVSYFLIIEALNKKNSKLIAKAIRNQALPYDFLLKIAEKGEISDLELLLENQIKLIAYPEIMEVMENNPHANNFINGKIKEIRDFYLKKENAEEIQADDVLDDLNEVITKDKQGGKKKKTETTEEGEEEDEDSDELQDLEVQEKALTTLQEINNMSISERIKLAITGAKTHRMILVKDPNKMISLAVLESPKITIDEIIILSKNKSLATDIIARISRNREWIKNYSIIAELVQNPKTPVKSALTFINRLHLRDLKLLSANKNTSPVIREFAANLFSQRMRTVTKR